ncbi:SRPBCC family protein [Cellulomonas massiliensis]|uniref:SRPBCC family protein n=1 Tax=Cellulomonas massiliensis TaxID=1465811 RepID=UPI00058DC44E|nr:SRPBCC family protein [Cellulomonas massiliensis]
MAAPPRAVLDVLADGWSYAAWVVGTSRIRAVERGFPQPGARIEHSVGVWPLVIDDETVVVAWDAASGIELQARGWPAGEARIRIEVRPRGDGSVVRISEDATDGPGRLVPRPLRTLAIGARNRETLRRLEALAARPGTTS